MVRNIGFHPPLRSRWDRFLVKEAAVCRHIVQRGQLLLRLTAIVNLRWFDGILVTWTGRFAAVILFRHYFDHCLITKFIPSHTNHIIVRVRDRKVPLVVRHPPLSRLDADVVIIISIRLARVVFLKWIYLAVGTRISFSRVASTRILRREGVPPLPEEGRVLVRGAFWRGVE